MAAAEIKTSLGIISISEQVLATIARDTALHIIRNKNVIIDLYICVKHGMRIPAVALQLQEAVKEDIFQYTGITVAEVNVNVQQIVFGAAR